MKLPAVYAIIDGDCLTARGFGLPEAADALIEGGMRLLQLRWKGSWTRDVYADAQRIAAACREVNAVFVVNDRPDIAMLVGAGVHVGQEDLPPASVRQLAGDTRLLGVSTHNEAQFLEAAAAPVDYIALGPIFGTVSKERPDPVVGTDELARLRTRYTGPLVAIGGITRDRAPQVWQAGADCLAVISDLYPPTCTKASVRARAQEWLAIAGLEIARHEQRG